MFLPEKMFRNLRERNQTIMSKKKHAEETSEQELEVNETSENEAEEAAAENAEAEETSEAPAEESADDKVKALEEELKKEKDNYMRHFAEFDNFRKRTSREKTEAYGDSAA